jgi:hypothetical protein
MNRVKVLAVVAVIGVVCATIGLAGTINYNSATSLNWVYDRFNVGGYAPTTDLLLFYDAGADHVPSAGDVLLNPPGPAGGAWADVGWYRGSFDTASTDLWFYATVYDAPTIAGASWYVNLGVGRAQFPTGSEPPYDYSQGSAVNGSDWVPIPEPTTMALAGLGLVIAAARRRFGKK